MIDDLERGAQGVIGRPAILAFAMHIQHETPHRHGGIAAIIDQLVPIAIAQLGDVAAESFQKIQRVLIGQAMLDLNRAHHLAQLCIKRSLAPRLHQPRQLHRNGRAA